MFKSIQKLAKKSNFQIRKIVNDSYNVSVAGLSEELEEFRNVVHDFAQRELAPRANQIDKENEFPMVSFLVM
jgi:alkylation response protein AidB-like acyl-CoA dehydrogenase